VLRAPIEGGEQVEELGDLPPAIPLAGSVGSVHEDLVAHPRVALAQRERRVEVSGLEDDQCVHGAATV